MNDDPALRIYERSLAAQWNADRGLDWAQSTAVATPEIDAARKRLINEPVSYTHLTLPTILRV